MTPSDAAATARDLALLRRGKVRDMYVVDDARLLMVASDRVSAFDVVMAEPIPGKGRVLTRLSKFWFERTRDVVPNHLISDDPEDLPPDVRPFANAAEGRWLLVQRAERIDIECVVRGYLAGSGWAEYRRCGTLADEPLPSGLRESEQLSAPVFTPAIKAESGHDENISRATLAAMIGSALADRLEGLSIDLYVAGAESARQRGLILADTKFEFGYRDGELILIDEALTPDSSRYWPADDYQPGRPQASFDKQFLRDFLDRSGWNKTPPPPPLPPHVVEGTARRYAEALERLTA
jgi:phosphoribosylaminoimidazole-succinocarboxamide synthase